jgi:hypothetical protein
MGSRRSPEAGAPSNGAVPVGVGSGKPNAMGSREAMPPHENMRVKEGEAIDLKRAIAIFHVLDVKA